MAVLITIGCELVECGGAAAVIGEYLLYIPILVLLIPPLLFLLLLPVLMLG